MKKKHYWEDKLMEILKDFKFLNSGFDKTHQQIINLMLEQVPEKKIKYKHKPLCGNMMDYSECIGFNQCREQMISNINKLKRG